MPLRSYKATSPGLRQMTRSTFEEITTDQPYKPLLEPQTRGSGPPDIYDTGATCRGSASIAVIWLQGPHL